MKNKQVKDNNSSALTPSKGGFQRRDLLKAGLAAAAGGLAMAALPGSAAAEVASQ